MAKIYDLSIGQVYPHGEVRSLNLHGEDAFERSHYDVFGVRRPAEQRFRWIDGIIHWLEYPNRSDYFAVQDHYENRGYRMKHQECYYNPSHVLNPKDLHEGALKRFGEFITEASKQLTMIGVIDSHGDIKVRQLLGPSQTMHHEEIWPWANISQRFRFENKQIRWWGTPTRSDYFAIEDFFYKLGYRNLKQYVLGRLGFGTIARQLNPQQLTEARVVSAIGAIDAHGVVKIHTFPERAGSSHLTHEEIFPWSKQSQRFRFDAESIWWWENPTRSDYFTVADYFDKLGFRNLEQHVYFIANPINPRRLKDV